MRKGSRVCSIREFTNAEKLISCSVATQSAIRQGEEREKDPGCLGQSGNVGRRGGGGAKGKGKLQ